MLTGNSGIGNEILHNDVDLVGRRMKINVHDPPNGLTQCEGIMFGVDVAMGLLAILDISTNTTVVINIAHIESLQIEERPTAALQQHLTKYFCNSSSVNLPPMDENRIRTTLERAVHDRLLPGSAVDIAGVELFNALTKQFPARRALRWSNDGSSIIVLDKIVVSGPWKMPEVQLKNEEENISASTSQGQGQEEDVAMVMQRVRAIIDHWKSSSASLNQTTANSGNSPSTKSKFPKVSQDKPSKSKKP